MALPRIPKGTNQAVGNENPFLLLSQQPLTFTNYINQYKLGVPVYDPNIKSGFSDDLGAAPSIISPLLGQPVIASIEFAKPVPNTEDSNTYTDLNDNSQPGGAGKIIQIPNVKFDTCLISVKQSKSIIKTKLPNRKGTVKEYIALDDYEVTIEGIISGVRGAFTIYPIDQVQDLVKLCEAPVSIQITSSYLNDLFDINYLVIEDYDISQEIGGMGQQKFTMSCVSDYGNDNNLIYDPYAANAGF